MTKAITVKQLGQYLKREITTDPFLRDLYVVGEITSLSKKKFTYFSLTEENESISCVYFDSNFPFEEGDEVVVKGSINLFLRDSRYQIKVDETKLVGEGSQLAELNKLKKKLIDKGYFDLDRKKVIPKFPYKIGLITGYNSAAYYDFLKVLNDNRYNCEIYLFHTLVQGEYASQEIVQALKYLDNENLDLIVLTRGGGSKDDLSVFNSELIADKLFEMNTPVISAIGHEIDLSISDLVADMYLSTPTKASEYITTNYVHSIKNVININKNIEYFIKSKLYESENIINSIKLNIKSNTPEYLIEGYIKDISILKNNIDYIINENINSIQEKVNFTYQRLQDSMKRIMEENYIDLLDIDKRPISFDELQINKNYYIKNKNTIYKILVEEKIDE
nr:exodeoxyribonuclease VII large subunit [Helcococcus sueciensis]